MNDQSTTRVYWEGNEVRFIRWTDQGLVFNWDDPRETAINMPRGTVRRLMSKGVLRVEGDMPTWTRANEDTASRRRTPTPPASRRQGAVPPVRPLSELSEEQKSQRVGILARLIRKLGTEGASG